MHQTKPVVAIMNNDVVFLKLLNTLIQNEMEAETATFQVGEPAYERIKRLHPSLVILDIDSEAPDRSWQFVDLLMLDPATAAIPVILCSVLDGALQERVEKLQEAGYIIIAKPFALDELLEHVRGVLWQAE